MLPTVSQYKKWSLPSKYTFWGLLIALIPLGVALTDWIISVPEYAVLAFNYGTSKIAISGAAGNSPETAVLIRGANSAEAGIKAEYFWLRRRYPGYHRISQVLIPMPQPGSITPKATAVDAATGAKVEAVTPAPLPLRLYDILAIQNWYGRTQYVFFDVTPFFTKKSEPRPFGPSPEEASQQTTKRLEEAKRRQNANPSTTPTPQYPIPSDKQSSTYRPK